MSQNVVRPLAGIAMLVVVAALCATAVVIFSGGAERATAVTVVVPRAGLVMDVDAKVKMRGVTVGRVSDVNYNRPDTAELTLAMDPGQLEKIPTNVRVELAAPTVFGAKSVLFEAPRNPAPTRLQPDQVLTSEDVEIEVNTVFGELTRVLSSIRPTELNAALTAISSGLSGRGDQLGRTLEDFNSFLRETNPALPELDELIRETPEVLEVYADSTDSLLGTVDNASEISETLVAEQDGLDAFLTSVIGLSDVGTAVLDENRGPLATALDLLVPTTALTDEYNEALTCTLNGFADLAVSPPADVPGLGLSANFLWGIEPYDSRDNLPKVAATGGPQCSVLPVGFQERPPYVVADTGANPHAPDRPGLELNVSSLQQALFGPIPDGAPR
ncbi:MCE family protein [Rhodococcus sp. NPDC058521]|uniref:MCE family protein n=1 Tax=Rhodococcus sp. NPDC058521 TaxID=3346536 RepID=UPI003656FA1A